MDTASPRWLTPPENALATRAVDRYNDGQLPAFNRAVERGGVETIPYLVAAQLDILVAGLLGIPGVVIRFGFDTSGLGKTISTAMLILFLVFLLLGVFRIFQGMRAKRHHQPL
jgi:hypothetical protein